MLNWIRNRPWLVGFLCGVLALTILFVISLYVPIVRDLCTYDEHGNPEHCTQHHIGPLVFIWALRQADAHNGFIAALSTVLLTWITYMLVKLGREDSKTQRAQLRAYVLVETSDLVNIDAGKKPNVRVKIKNFGQTPAHSVRVGITIGVDSLPPILEPPTFTYEGAPARTVGSRDFWYATTELDFPLNTAQAIEILENRMAIFVIGKISYLDIFEDEHETTFCLYWNESFGPSGMGVYEGMPNIAS